MWIREVALALLVVGIMMLGILAIKRLDKLLKENRRNRRSTEKETDQVYIGNTANMSDEELVERVRDYEKKHGDINITLSQNDKDVYEGRVSNRR